jgi:hypothetical protein
MNALKHQKYARKALAKERKMCYNYEEKTAGCGIT